MLSAALSTVAAGRPMTFTSPLSPPLMMPAKGCGSGVGTGGPGAGGGTMTMCVSVATIWSPCLAAGCPNARPLLPVRNEPRDDSVEIDGRALDVRLPRRLQIHVASGLDLHVAGRLDHDLLRLERNLPLRRREHDILVRRDGDRVLR